MSADALSTPLAAQVAEISHQDLRQLVRRELMLFPGTPGENENSPRTFDRLGVYEAAILGALHQDLGLTWPKAAVVFSRLAKMLAENLPGKMRWHVPAEKARTILMDRRDSENPVFLLFTFTILDEEVAAQPAFGWDDLTQTMRSIREMGSSAGDAMGILNLTSLLARTDANLAAMEIN
ncbi:MAG: hypothetical protein RIA64_11035 [Rhodospirillales bacterium]